MYLDQFNKSHLSFLLAGLVSLRAQAEDEFSDSSSEGQPFVADAHTGICGNVLRYISKAVLPDEIVDQPVGEGGSRTCIEETAKYLKIELFSSWLHYSGNEYYPVPATIQQREAFEDEEECWGASDPAVAAEYAFDNSDVYWEGDYGDYRRDLLYHMIDTLTAYLVKHEPVAVPNTSGVTTYGSPAAAHKPSHGGYPG